MTVLAMAISSLTDRVEEGSNISAVALRVVGGDENGIQYLGG
jgi:hypothetical protein